MASINAEAIRCEPVQSSGSHQLWPIYHTASGVLVGHPAEPEPFIKGIAAYPLLLDLDDRGRIVHFELVLKRDLWTIGDVVQPLRAQRKDLSVKAKGARNTVDTEIAVVTDANRSQVQITIGPWASVSAWYALSERLYAGVAAEELRCLLVTRFEVSR